VSLELMSMDKLEVMTIMFRRIGGAFEACMECGYVLTVKECDGNPLKFRFSIHEPNGQKRGGILEFTEESTPSEVEFAFDELAKCVSSVIGRGNRLVRDRFMDRVRSGWVVRGNPSNFSQRFRPETSF